MTVTSAPRILIADDNELNRKILSRQLDRLGFPAEAVVSGEEVVQAFFAGGHGLVLMDVNMGDMDGYEATDRIRMREGESRTPIIGITANNDVEERTRCLNAGMDDFLAKPIRLAELAKLLVRWGAHGRPDAGAESAPKVIADGALDFLHRLERACVRSGLVAEIIEEFLEHGQARLRRLQKALERGEVDRVERERFALYMSSQGVGALRVAQVMELFTRAVTPVEQSQLAELAKDELIQAKGELDPITPA